MFLFCIHLGNLLLSHYCTGVLLCYCSIYSISLLTLEKKYPSLKNWWRLTCLKNEMKSVISSKEISFCKTLGQFVPDLQWYDFFFFVPSKKLAGELIKWWVRKSYSHWSQMAHTGQKATFRHSYFVSKLWLVLPSV